AQSQGTLRWVVIDEAHNYMGSQAAELTLLLRRVLHAFGCHAEAVHFVATSATIADAEGKTDERLREFLADMAGLNVDRGSVGYGHRQVPPLPDAALQNHVPLSDVVPLTRLSPQERFVALAAAPRVRQWRAALIQQPRLLSDLAGMAWHDD